MILKFPAFRLCAVIGAMLTLLGPRVAHAQVNDDVWRFTIVPYIWVPSTSTKFRVNDVPVQVEADTKTTDLFDKLDFALLVCGEVRKGKIGLLYDFQTLKLSDGGMTTGDDPRDYHTHVTVADATLALQYRLIEESQFSLDGFGGVRIIYADLSADVDPGATHPGASGGQSETWVDPIVGIKGIYRLSDHWALLGYGDIGGFGVSSQLTYEVMGTVSYRFNEHCAIHGGYRVYAVDFERGTFKLDTTMYGPIVGLAFNF